MPDTEELLLYKPSGFQTQTQTTDVENQIQGQPIAESWYHRTGRPQPVADR